jgi:hypothetical protein
LIANGITGTYSTTSPVLATQSITAFVPPTASRIGLIGMSNWKGGAQSSVLVAPNTSYGGTNNGPTGSAGQVYPLFINGSFTLDSRQVSMVLEGTSVATASNAAGFALTCFGWKDGYVNAP